LRKPAAQGASDPASPTGHHRDFTRQFQARPQITLLTGQAYHIRF
jgi:hypothetical protein